MIFQIIFGVLAIALLWAVGIYNSLVKFRNRTKEAWADIDVQLKRRYNLIPNLVETVKGYASHEKNTLDAVITARSKATQMTVDPTKVTADQMKAFSQAQIGLSQVLGRLMVLSERYPDLKANQNFLELQRELRDTEDKVQAARRFYNANVRDLNIAIESFPANMIANSLGFAKMDLFELIAPEERETPKVKF